VTEVDAPGRAVRRRSVPPSNHDLPPGSYGAAAGDPQEGEGHNHGGGGGNLGYPVAEEASYRGYDGQPGGAPLRCGCGGPATACSITSTASPGERLRVVAAWRRATERGRAPGGQADHLVPTSIGYGASFQGWRPYWRCSIPVAGRVAVVNIDNGFGAATGLPHHQC